MSDTGADDLRHSRFDAANSSSLDTRAQTTGGSLSLSLSFNGHFPGEPGLAGVY